MVDMFMNGILVIVLWYVSFYTIPLKNINKVQNSQEEMGIFQLLFTISWISICIVVVVDIGSAFLGDTLLFYALNEILSLSIFSRLLSLAYLFMVFKGTIRLTRTVLRSESYIIQSRINGVAFANGLIAVGLSTFMIYIQSALFGEMRFLYGSNQINLIYEFIIGGILFLTPCILLIINGMRYIKYESVSREAKREIIPINLFISFGYIIVIKALSLFILYTSIRKAINNKFNKRNDFDEEDFLLLGTTLSKKSIVGKINAYFLLSSFVAFFLLFYMSSSPFPLIKTAYANGHFMIVMSMLAIFLFFIIEQISRSLKRVGKFIRFIFIPSFMTMMVWPFYTDNSQMSSYIVDSKGFSIYHQLARSLGNDRYILFIYLFMLVACISYLMHILTGEIDREKHATTIIPIIGWLQLLITSIWYPLVIISPPYSIVEHKNLLVIIMAILIVILILGVGTISFYIFSSEKSNISLYISGFWKKKWRVYLIVSLLTIAAFTPIFMKINKPIMNVGIVETWENDYITDDDFTIQAVIPKLYKGMGLLLTNTDSTLSRLLLIDPINGEVTIDKTYDYGIDAYYLWNDDKIVLLKADKKGYIIIDLSNYRVEYEETIANPNSYEYLSININENAALVTMNDQQYLYDADEGYIELKTIGNNYYKLIQGNQSILYKNNTFYQIIDGDILAISVDVAIQDYDFVYADDYGFIVYQKGQLFMLDNMFEETIGDSYDFSNNPIDYPLNHSLDFQPVTTKTEDSVPINIDSEIISTTEPVFKDSYMVSYNYFVLLHSNNDTPYAYLFNVKDFKNNVLMLVNKIKTYKDNQQVYIYNENGDYILYDNYQISVYENDNMIAQLWYELSGQEIDNILSPVLINNRLIWFTRTGEGHGISIKGETDDIN